jgi:hypothetical protein
MLMVIRSVEILTLANQRWLIKVTVYTRMFY